MGATEAGVPTTKFDHRMLSNDPTADHVTGGNERRTAYPVHSDG
jgi:hypothetical protein